MKSTNTSPEDQLKNALKIAASESKTIGLSKQAKKEILNNILPKQPWFLTFKFAVPAFASILLITFSSLTLISKPGDLLYGVKRHVEDTRSSVDDSYDKTLLEQRLIEKNDILQDTDQQNSEQKVDIVDKEIEEIADRIDQKSISNTTNASQNTEQNSTATDDTHADNSTDSAESTHDTHSTTESSHKAAQQACKDALDARKRAGENINSDLYKTCDSL